jgi:dihydrofolate reductase
MGQIVLDMAISVDGFVSGPNGEDSGLHDWYFAPSPTDTLVIEELLQTIGAMIIGHRAFGHEPDGFETPYKVPHFVLTHTARPTVANTGVPFIFVTDGIEALVAQAQAAAGNKVVCVAGGAETAQQLLAAGHIDTIQLHVVSRLLGSGLRLFADGLPTTLERTRLIESPGVTHIFYQVIK